MSTTVAIVEDNYGICEELKHVISNAPDLACVCVCRNARVALQQLPQHQPDVVIMDVQLPDGSGIDCTARLKPVMRASQFLMFTIHDEPEQISRALAAGAIGYVLKSADPAEIIAAVREAKLGGAPLSRDVGRKVVEMFHREAARDTETLPQLTEREHEVLSLVARGLIDKEIASCLSISLQTVNSHLKHIYNKLQVHSRTEAVVKYLHERGA